jgi:integrase
MNELVTTGAELRQQDPAELLLGLADCYTSATRVFVRYLQEQGGGIDPDSIRGFSADIRQEHEGKRLAARSVNYYVNGMKARVRFLLSHSPELDEGRRAAIETALAECKLEKVQETGVPEDKCLSHEQIERLIAAASKKSPRMALILEWLAFTGCRISETLGVLLSDVRYGVEESTGTEIARVTLHGKFRKDRTVIVKRELVERIRSAFESKRYLFGHNGQTYTREYVSMFIRRLSAKTLRKAVAAHALRHSWFTNRLHEDPGLLKEISSYGGHASTSTTVDLYLHGTFKARDVLSRFHDYSAAGTAVAKA